MGEPSGACTETIKPVANKDGRVAGLLTLNRPRGDHPSGPATKTAALPVRPGQELGNRPLGNFSTGTGSLGHQSQVNPNRMNRTPRARPDQVQRSRLVPSRAQPWVLEFCRQGNGATKRKPQGLGSRPGAPGSKPPKMADRVDGPIAATSDWLGPHPARQRPPKDDRRARGGGALGANGVKPREWDSGELAIQQWPNQEKQPGCQTSQHHQAGACGEVAVGGLQHHGGEGELAGVGSANGFNREGKGI